MSKYNGTLQPKDSSNQDVFIKAQPVQIQGPTQDATKPQQQPGTDSQPQLIVVDINTIPTKKIDAGSYMAPPAAPTTVNGIKVQVDGKGYYLISPYGDRWDIINEGNDWYITMTDKGQLFKYKIVNGTFDYSSRTLINVSSNNGSSGGGSGGPITSGGFADSLEGTAQRALAEVGATARDGLDDATKIVINTEDDIKESLLTTEQNVKEVMIATENNVVDLGKTTINNVADLGKTAMSDVTDVVKTVSTEITNTIWWTEVFLFSLMALTGYGIYKIFIERPEIVSQAISTAGEVASATPQAQAIQSAQPASSSPAPSSS